MPISIITRAYKTSELRNLINNLNSNNKIEREVIAVCNINDYDIKNVKLIIENSKRFEARITGIKNAIYDKILLLDSDQIPEEGLLEELENKKDDMVIIPERSINNTYLSRCLDDWRYRNERRAKKNITPYIPVIPRFYRRECLLNAVNKLSTGICKIIDHEDSILYYYAFQETKDINFSEKHIFNYDPKFFELMHKAYLYGKNRKNTNNLKVPEDISLLLYKLNKSTLNIKDLGLGNGYLIQTLRAIAYEFGRIL